ncbi:hypothetical protein GYMLUDRAFT_57629 [Collybiopsis luxurians FD-317 M1]|uniref:Unplaced genomic scaffold GYMLUscaffold_16, whole genome shotgun sequence n=1 Tax=Collybiopsis luxurians FD-317 M1 TaxID=944289 RepID=A0A0D0C5L6_9AGAR|nr:hypothetical protein GYMLUDRAFT_57629 [Collybiopsis luxurians FD-317 M1]
MSHIQEHYKELLEDTVYLGNPHPFPVSCQWYELDRMKRYCWSSPLSDQTPSPLFLTIVGRMSANLNNTGIFGGWTVRSQFKPQRARRTFLLGAPLAGTLREHWPTAVSHLKKIQNQATTNSTDVRYLFLDDDSSPLNSVIRIGSGVFRDLAPHEALDENLVAAIPSSKKEDSEWLKISQTKALCDLVAFAEDGSSIPLRRIRSAISGSLVKVTFSLRCWRYSRSDPFSFAADVSRIDIIQPASEHNTLTPFVFSNITSVDNLHNGFSFCPEPMASQLNSVTMQKQQPHISSPTAKANDNSGTPSSPEKMSDITPPAPTENDATMTKSSCEIVIHNDTDHTAETSQKSLLLNSPEAPQPQYQHEQKHIPNVSSSAADIPLPTAAEFQAKETFCV